MRVENLGRQMFSEHDRHESAQRVFTNVIARRFTETHPQAMAATIAARDFSNDQALATTVTPAWLRAVMQVARAPIASRHAARPFLPLSLTNAWWRVVG